MSVPTTAPTRPPVSLLVPTFPEDCQPAKILPEKCAFTDLYANSYIDALEQLARRLEHCGAIPDANSCMADILEREQVASTMLENGIALPRARTAQVNRLLAAVATCQLDNPEDPAHRRIIILLSLSPKNHETPYLPFIAHVARVLLNHPDLDALINLKNPAHLRAAFL